MNWARRRRNERLVRILGYTRAGYAAADIAHLTGVDPAYVARETTVATTNSGAVIDMLRDGTEHTADVHRSDQP